MMDQTQIVLLYRRYLAKTCSPEERATFLKLLSEISDEQTLTQLAAAVQDPLRNEDLSEMDDSTADAIWYAIKKSQGLPVSHETQQQKGTLRKSTTISPLCAVTDLKPACSYQGKWK